MNYQQRKREIMQSLKNKRLMENYRNNQAKQEGNLSQKILDGAEFASSSLDNINKAKSFIDKFKTPAPSSLLSNPMSQNVGQIGQYGLNTQLLQNSGELASKIGATNIGGASQATGIMSNAGKAVPVVGAVAGGLSAANNFANGKTTDGALDIAKTGAMFIPGVGWAVAGAIQIAQMLKGFKDKADQKAMAKSQEEAAKSQQLSMQSMQDKKQGLEQQRQENLVNMQEQMQPSQSNQDITNDIMAQYQALNNEPQEGVVTGGAAPIGMPTNYQEENMPLPYEGSSQEYLDKINAKKQSLMDIFKGGLNTAGDKIPSLVDALKNGVQDFSAGYKDNTENGFKDGDLYKQSFGITPTQNADGSHSLGAKEDKKSIMARLGEMAGTGQRIMANPWTQAIIAGGISAADGGDVGDIAQVAFKYGTDKAKADNYYRLTTGKNSTPVFNTYGVDDYRAKLTKDNHDDTMNKWQQDLNYRREKDVRDYNYKVNKDKKDRAIKNKELEMRQAYYKSRSNNDSAARLAWQKEKDRRDNELKLAKQEFDYKNKQLSNQADFGMKEEEYKGLFGNTKIKKVPITQEEAMQSAYDEYMEKVNGIMNGGSTYDNEQEALEAELRRRGLI